MAKLITRKETADLLSLKPQTLAKWAMTGKNLPVIRIGNRAVRYSLADVMAFIEKCTAVSQVFANPENEEGGIL
jgi:predicted DNA-binding transcriptional regulator AlpA